MKLNLRQARKLENKIGAFVGEKQRELHAVTSIRVNEDSATVDKLINEARNTFFNEFNNINNLVTARQTIRNSIGKVNQTQGVNDFISQKVLAEAKLSKINNFLCFAIYDKNETQDSLDYHKKLLDNGESRFAKTSVTAAFLTNIDEEKFKTDKRELVNQIEDLDNKLAKMNYTVEVQLDGNTVKLLKDNLLL
jgi:hypothetical protein